MNHHLNYSENVGFKESGQRATKRILLIMLVICMAFSLSSCGGTAKGKKENQIKDDVSEALSQDAALSGYNLKCKFSFDFQKAD